MTARQAKMQREVSEALLRIAPDRVDRLTALMHFIAADMQAAKFTPEEVVGYLTSCGRTRFNSSSIPATASHYVRSGRVRGRCRS